jgi:hypothetical protein
MEKVFSRYYYPIEFYNPHVHLECNYNKSGLNEAEIKALEEEESRNKNKQMKEIKSREFIEKYNKSALLYEEEQKMKTIEQNLIKQKQKDEKLLKTKNFNKAVYQKNMKPFLKQRELKEKTKTLKKLNKSKSANKMQIKKNNNQPKNRNHIEKEFNTIDNNYYNYKKNNDLEGEEYLENKKTIDNLDNINKLNLNVQNNTLKNNIKLNNDVIDLRRELENQLLEEIKNKNKILNINGIVDDVNEKIGTIKRFRSYGYLPEQEKIFGGRKKKKGLKNKKYCSEFEKRRFIKALKNIITERLGEHNIYIQNICSCGNLKKQLTSLVEKGNFTIYALTEVECANNCVFYKNKKAYLKNINDVLKSIKDISYENFHNQY